MCRPAACNGRNRARTCDPLLVREVLYQLSYSPVVTRGPGYLLPRACRSLPIRTIRAHLGLRNSPKTVSFGTVVRDPALTVVRKPGNIL
jgi:hypothetical protein